MLRLSKPKLVVLLISCVLLCGLLYALWSSRASEANTGKPDPSKRPITVKTAVSQRQDLQIFRDIPATIAPLNQVVLRPQISGQIEQLYFEEGQAVQAGQLLATLDSRTLRAELASTEAELSRIQSQLELAQQEQQRYQSLLATQAVSQQEVAQFIGQTKQLQAQFNAAKASVQAQQVRVSLTRIVAPITGRVGLRQVSVGAQVSSNDANGLATLTQTQPISVQFGLPEQLLSDQTLLGRRIELRSISGDQLLAQTTIARQDSQIDPKTGSLAVRAMLPNTDQRFWSGQSVRVRLAEQSFEQVVTVPNRAIQQGLNQTFVYVLQDGIAKRTPVTRLAQSGDLTAVDGLSADTEVVIEGQLRLKDGSKAQVQSSAQPSTQPRPNAQPQPQPQPKTGAAS
ncbi:MAG: efflux RND transporter periplasmic adaptor subunit [Flavobacteriales bacterium]